MRAGRPSVAVGQLNHERGDLERYADGDTRRSTPLPVVEIVISRSATPIPEPVREVASDCRRTASKILCVVSPTFLSGGLLFALLQENMNPVVRLGGGVACGIISIASCVAAWRLSRPGIN